MKKIKLTRESKNPYPIPENWKWTNISNVISDIKNGTILKQNKSGKGLNVTRIECIQNNKIDLSKLGTIQDNTQVKEHEFYKKGDIVLSHINNYEHIGKTCLIRQEHLPLVHGMNLLRLRFAHDILLPDFAIFFTQSMYFKNNIQKRINRSVNQVSINKKRLGEISIPIPPIDEQRKIVNKLESLLSKINESKILVEQAKETFKNRQIAIISKALKGSLSSEWRTNLGIKKNWELVNIGSLVKFLCGGTPSKSVKEYWQNGDIYWASVKDIKDENLYSTEDKITIDGLNNSSANLAIEGDLILITRMNPGKSCISMIKTAINQDLKIVRPINDQVDINFLHLFFKLNIKTIEEQSQGTIVKGITIDKLNLIKIGLPSLEEQKEIVRIVTNLLQIESEAKIIIDDIEKNIDMLEKSILSKAFSGKLILN